MPHSHITPNLGLRLGIGFGCIVILMLAIAGLGMRRLADLNDALNLVVADRWPKTVIVNGIIDDSDRIAVALRNMMLAMQPDQRDADRQKVQEARQRISAGMDKLDKVLIHPRARGLLKAAVDAQATYLATDDALIRVVDEGRHVEARALLQNQLPSALAAYQDRLRDLVAFQGELMDASGRLAQEQYRATRSQVLTLVASSLVLTLGIGIWVSRSILAEFAARQAAEAALQKAHAELESRVAQRTAELDESNRRLAKQTTDLARSNADLEQFAYVASHDLQEPLRMISGYTQLLAKRYRGRLDSDADEFIEYAVDGAARMQRLIDDLLAFSRVDTRGRKFAPTRLDEVMRQVQKNLKAAIEEAGATVRCEALPVVCGDAAQMESLLQNLIGNAIKFRGDVPPEVRVAAERRGPEWEIVVSDNGIGIDPKYAEKIFVIFQRLHAASEYPGTGIGLSVCKRIVERHGGRIWVVSEPGHGAAFHFTLPDERACNGDGGTTSSA